MTSKKTLFTFIDLFSGIGSFHYSLKKLGGECVLACDIDQNANSTYILNYGVIPHENIFDLQIEQIPYCDLLCAGFPCQAFSNIGFKKAWKDSRSQVFYPLLNILKSKQIPCVLLENVQGLVNLKKGQVFNKILTHLKDLNYECFWKVLNCSDYGIPQNRKRLFIVGFHKRILQNTGPLGFEFPPKMGLQCTLSELLNKHFDQEIARTIRIGGRGSPLGNRHNWDGYTILQPNTKLTTEYRLSIQDCLLLQNFPKSFQLCGCQTSQYKQIGNTIPTNLTFVLGKQVIKFFQKKKAAYFQQSLKVGLKAQGSHAAPPRVSELRLSKKPCLKNASHQRRYVATELLGLLPKINGLNSGEIGEYMIKAQLLCLQNQHIRFSFGYIQKLENEPDQLIKNKKLTLFKLHKFTKAELINCFVKSNISKSKANSKADIFINNQGVSIKTLEQGYPTIINHTHRQSFLRVLEYLKLDIQILDTCITEYHFLRKNNRIGEDILNSNPLSPFHKFKSYFQPILAYFLFDGSGRGISNLRAENLLVVKKIFMPQYWYWFPNSQQFIDKVWDFLVFSIRDKGLNYEKRSCESQKKMDPWIHQYKSKKTKKFKKKGCLHVRIHSSFKTQLQNYKFLEQNL